MDCSIETMQELDCEIAVATETWFRTGQELEKKLLDYEYQSGYAVIKRCRSTGRGGGVAIVYKKGDLKMDEVKTNKKYEIVAAIARRTGQRRKIATIAVYIPPNYNSDQNAQCLEYINGLVASIKQKYNAPYVIIAGDFNHRTVSYTHLTLPTTPYV